jgi:hypothetical protein
MTILIQDSPQINKDTIRLLDALVADLLERKRLARPPSLVSSRLAERNKNSFLVGEGNAYGDTEGMGGGEADGSGLGSLPTPPAAGGV